VGECWVVLYSFHIVNRGFEKILVLDPMLGWEDTPMVLRMIFAHVFWTQWFSIHGFGRDGFSVHGSGHNGFLVHGFGRDGFSVHGIGCFSMYKYVL